MKETKSTKTEPGAADQPPVSKIGRYLIVRELGRGAMGIVYEAIDPVIQRKVALKTIRFDRFSSGEELAELQTRFLHEAQAAGGLSHPNIVTIYDVGIDQDATFLAMEFIEGSSLEHLISTKRKWPIETVVAMVSKIGEALEYAHEKGIIHRDVKPANILVDHAGRPRIVDFGIARLASSTMTRTSMTLGTPSYMAPEQIAGQKVDKRADIFSLGVILYEMLTYQKPFTGSDVTTIIFKIMQQDPPLPRAIEREIPRGLEYVIMKSLSKSLENRYQSCREFNADLADYKKYENWETPKTAEGGAAAVIASPPAGTIPAVSTAASSPPERASGDAAGKELTDTVTIRKPSALAASAAASTTTSKKRNRIALAAVAGGIIIIAAAFLLFGPSRTPKPRDDGGVPVTTVEQKPAPPYAGAATPKTEPAAKDAAVTKPEAGDLKPQPADAGGAQKTGAPAEATAAKTGAEAPPRGANPAPPKPAPASGGGSQSSEKPESPVRIYTIAKILKRVEPVYPDKARKDKIEGLIVLEVTVDREGRVTNAKVLRSIPALDQAAIQAVMQWRYEPQIIRGRPRAFICSATVVFKAK